MLSSENSKKNSIPWLGPLRKLLRADEITSDPRRLAEYSGDKWFASHQPQAVVLPRNTQTVSRILAFANRHKVAVTARGAGYG
jgi:glycolate oxidase